MEPARPHRRALVRQPRSYPHYACAEEPAGAALWTAVAVERARQGWSVEDVAEAAGVSPEIIRDAEGKHAAAVDSTLWRVLSAMDLKVARVDLVDGARQPFP